MITKQLEQKISELQKRIGLLETQRPIINVYPYYQQPITPNYHPSPITGPWSDPTTGGTNTPRDRNVYLC